MLVPAAETTHQDPPKWTKPLALDLARLLVLDEVVERVAFVG